MDILVDEAWKEKVGSFGHSFPNFVLLAPIDEFYIHEMTGSRWVTRPKLFQDQNGEPSN